MYAWKIFSLTAILLGLILAGSFSALAEPEEAEITEDTAGFIRVVTIKGTIDPATAGYIIRGIDMANENNDPLFLIELDTPGGLVNSTQDIIKAMLASEVPIAVYVTPEGSMASSAGTFITVAAQVAAMAPTTHIGSATPISGGDGGDLEKKITHAMSSYMKTLAERRGRNAEWAVKAVEEGISATESEALELNVIDFISPNRASLLESANGMQVQVAGKEEPVAIRTAGAVIVEIPMTSQERLMHFLANPTVLGILIMVAIYGIIGEISNPGGIFPGVLGGIALILVFYSSNLLPMSATALLLIAFAIILFLLDTQIASQGILTAGGVVAMAMGLFLLVDSHDPAFRMSIYFVISAALVTGAFFSFAVGAGLRAQRRSVTTGHEGLVGKQTTARTDIDPVGRIYLFGSWWTAETLDEPIKAGEMLEVKSVQGLRLFVKKIET